MNQYSLENLREMMLEKKKRRGRVRSVTGVDVEWSGVVPLTFFVGSSISSFTVAVAVV